MKGLQSQGLDSKQYQEETFLEDEEGFVADLLFGSPLPSISSKYYFLHVWCLLHSEEHRVLHFKPPQIELVENARGGGGGMFNP